MEAVECGAAALASILAYFGRWVPLEQLRHECGVSRDGSKANNILRAARKYGLVAKGFRQDLETLYKQAFPVILFWNLNHFVVLEGFKRERVFLNDPAQGPRVVSLEELDGAFSGIVLTFERGPDFRKGGTRPAVIPALRARLRGLKWALVYIIVCGLFLVIPGLAIPTFTRIFIDDYLISDQQWLLRPLLLAMLAALVVQGSLTWLQKHYLLRLETKLALSTSSRFFTHILRLPATYFAQRYSGEVGSRVLINDEVAQVLSGKLAATVVDSFLIVFYAALMYGYDATLTVIVIAIASLNVAVVKLSARPRTNATHRLMQDRGKLIGVALNGLQMIETIKATGSEAEFFSRWAGHCAKTVNTTQRLSVMSQVSTAVPGFVETLSTATVLALGGLKVMNGDLTVGMLVAYQTLLGSFTRPLASFVWFGSTLQELRAQMNRLDDVLRNPEDRQYIADPRQIASSPEKIKLAGKVELRNITFGYSPLDPPLIENFGLRIDPARRVAIVGASGSGKSTVARLIAGLYEPWDGEVLFDDVPRRQLPRDLLVNSISLVDQEIFFFGGTVTDNITMWDSTISVGRIGQACRDAAIDDTIATRAGGYQSEVQEGGRNFSGGQCQRLEIARALVGEPTIVVLDEATSVLDATTEATIDDSIRRLGCTCIIIAHRLSTIRDADEIIVMEAGRIVQRGTHEEMKDLDGPYQRLISN
jgi:NHLM bacteriocin system ABC transporter peptidase/ATP-binding protein